jgi:hypothetical protein
MKDNVEVLLEDAGAQWRAGQPTPEEPDWPAITTRSKRPLWAAAAAVVIALVVALTVTFWPSDDTEPAHPLPLPTSKGAIVPAPNVVEHSQPVGSYCPTSGLTGSLVIDGTIGRLHLSLRPGIDKRCNLPGMLYGSTAVQFVDHAGHVRAAGIDPRSQQPANPPYFGPLVLGPGDVATMYLRAQSEFPCLPTGSHAVIRYNNSAVVVPISGPAKCTNSAKQMGFLYGPFSTPGHAFAFEPAGWTNLSAALHFPSSIPASGAVRFTVTLTNRSRTQAVTLSPCPRFGMVISSDKTAYEPQGTLKCTGKPVAIQPGHSRRFTAVYRQDFQASPGDYAVGWAIPGVKTAYARTTVR